MKKSSSNISSGYKPSPLGIIPEDWEVKRLGEVCNFLDSQRVPIKDGDRVKMQGKYPYYGASGIIDYVNDYLFDDDLILLGEDGANILTRSTPLAFLVSGKVWVNNHAHVLKTSTNHNRYYICNYLESLSYDKYNTGTAQPKLNREICENIPILLPNIYEQNKIADILQLWDTAIAKQTAMIEQLTLRKRGLMQQLLTGKKRLKGFGGEWKEVRLGEIGTAYGGLVNKNKEDFENGNALFITYMNVFSNGKIDINNLGQVRILPSEKQEQVQYGDIFFTVSSETPEEVGMASVLLNEVQNTYLNSFCFGYRLNDFKSIIPVYAPYLFRGDDFRKKMYKIAQGSTRFNISKTEVLNMRITIPSIEEQNTIASVLVDVDKEIEIHKQKLVAMQAQKKGLMQVLLTGKKRIK